MLSRDPVMHNLVHNYMITALYLKTVAQFIEQLKVIIEYVKAQRVGSIFLSLFSENYPTDNVSVLV